MSEPISIPATTARRFILGRQGLWPGRRWEGKAGTQAAMFAGEYVQLDPLVILARSHDLVLHARVHGYEPGLFHDLAYGERLFFEWGGWLAVRPMAELPCWRVVMRRERNRPDFREIAETHRDAVARVRHALRERGTVTGRDFPGGGPALQHYRGSKDTTLALYYLWRTGEAMTHHREGFQRVYAASEEVAPAHLLAEAPEEEADLVLARKAIAFAGIGRFSRFSQPLSRLLGRPVARQEETAIERRLVESGALVPIKVDGWRGTQFVAGEELDRLAQVDCGGVPAEWVPPDAGAPSVLTLLSPLDPLVARRRAKELFGLDYQWEIYLPPGKVQFGRYVLPILWGEELVGRVDLKLDRQRAAVVVIGLWMEPGEAEHLPEFATAFGLELRRLMEMLGARSLDLSAVRRSPLRKTLNALCNHA